MNFWCSGSLTGGEGNVLHWPQTGWNYGRKKHVFDRVRRSFGEHAAQKKTLKT